MKYRTLEPGETVTPGDWSRVKGSGNWYRLNTAPNSVNPEQLSHMEYRRPIPEELNEEGWRKCEPTQGEQALAKALAEIERLKAALVEADRLRQEAVASEGRALARSGSCPCPDNGIPWHTQTCCPFFQISSIEGRAEVAEEERDRLSEENEKLREVVIIAHRLQDSDYTEWQSAGPNPCKHGFAEGVPCRKCDRATIRNAAKAIKQ